MKPSDNGPENEKKDVNNKDQEKKDEYRKDKNFRKCLDLTLQISLWLVIFWLMACKMQTNSLIIALLIGVYIFYLINAFNSPEWNYVNNIVKKSIFQDKMKTIFCTAPKIHFIASSFHFSRSGKRRTKVVSHTDIEEFKYYTGRDISGLLNLDYTNIVKKQNKKFIQLKLSLDLEFEDSMSKLDYYIQKDNFIQKNEKIDIEFDFKEEANIPGYEEYTLVNLGESDPFWLNKFFYIGLTVIIPVVEIFKMIINNVSSTEEFTIRKVFSTRNDLTNPLIAGLYSDRNPKLIMNGIMYSVEDYLYFKRKYYDDADEMEKKKAADIIKLYKIKLSKYLTKLDKREEEIVESIDERMKKFHEKNKKEEGKNKMTIEDDEIYFNNGSTRGHSAPSEIDKFLIQ